MIATETSTFAFSHSAGPAAALRRLLRHVRQNLRTISGRQNHVELTDLAQGYETMASQRAAAGADVGARYYEAHARAIRDAMAKAPAK